MIRELNSRLLTLTTNKTVVWSYRRSYASGKELDPLRILFCGSDEFSIKSLKALCDLQKEEPNTIHSIDVVSRPPKRTGRGLKKISEVPILHIARGLSLPLHQIDTFTGWQLPQYNNSERKLINLIVAVSFGLLVPARLLQLSKYGGLNVHPSTLPEFRGAAPLHHALLAGRRRTGVTLQTLHPKKMDHGQILLQTPGIEIANHEQTAVSELIDIVAPIGADLLIRGIRERLFVPPIENLAPLLSDEEIEALPLAPKITAEDRHIRWDDWSMAEILRRQRIIGPLWSQFKAIGGKIIRVVWSAGLEECRQVISDCKPGEGGFSERGPYIYLKTHDGKVVRTRAMKVEGYGERSASQIALKLGIVNHCRTEETLILDGDEVKRLPPAT